MSIHNPAGSLSRLLEGPLPKFSQELDDRLKCGICKQMLRNPKQTQCGHRVCARCIEQYLDDYGEGCACPYEEEFCEPLHRNQIFPDPGAVREILTLQVHCPNMGGGCKEKLPWNKLQAHISNCQFTAVSCRNEAYGCKEKILKRNEQSHLEVCDYQPLECNMCQEMIARSRIEEHRRDECPMGYVSCPYNCGEGQLLRSELAEHSTSCEAQPKNCKYNRYGCTFKGNEQALAEHEVEDMSKHLEFVVFSCAQLDLKTVELEEKIQVADTNRELLMAAVQRTTSENISLKETAEHQEKKIKNLQKLVADQGTKVIQLENVLAQKVDVATMSRLQKDVSNVRESVATLAANAGPSNQSVQGGLVQAERQLGVHDVRLAEMDIRFQVLESTSYDGTLIWKISDYTRRKNEAKMGRTMSLYSQPFYTSRYGYKMCGRIYLNGDGIGKGTHVSLFFVIMKGEYDALLPWPFRQKVTLMLLDQETGTRNLCDTFRPDPTSSSFRKPLTEMNVASGCPKFVSQQVADTSSYTRDDTLYVKIIVDTSDLCDM